ncbi:MAG: LCP family protein, partial [Lachnospiraceae bacterium]
MGKRKPIEKMTKRQRAQLRKKKMIKRISILVMEVIILTILGVVSYGVVKLDRLGHQTLDHQKLEVYKDTGPYTNIALFGLDSREGEIKKGVRSDTIMIASINNDTGTVKLLSVFRDTLLQQQDGTYEKANAAYSYGG